MNKINTIILPGYSLHNKDWAYKTAEYLQRKSKSTIIVHEWRHWSDSSLSLSISKEIEKILDNISDEKVNLIAKSVGVFVAFKLILEILDRVNKVVFCGIASVEGEDRKDLLKAVLKIIPVENILCLQNENDKFVTYFYAEKFYHTVEAKLKVVSKPRSDHEYPYYEDFYKFLY